MSKSKKALPYTKDFFDRDEVTSVVVTTRLTGKWLELWKELIGDIDAESQSAVIKEALRLRGFVLQQQKQKRTIHTIVEIDGQEEEVDNLTEFLDLSHPS